MEKAVKQLDIYIDESGNFDSYSKHNLIYSVAFIMVDSSDKEINDKQVSIFESKLSNIVGGDHFVHVGNLVIGLFMSDHELVEKLLYLAGCRRRWKLRRTGGLLFGAGNHLAGVFNAVDADTSVNTWYHRNLARTAPAERA